MSDEESTTKGGHAPAEKIAGGVRITRKERVTSTGDSSNSASEKLYGEDDPSFDLEKKSHNELHAKAYIKQIKRDFPTEGTKAIHEKPHPTRESAHHTDKQHQSQIFQPRKQ